MMTSFSFHGCSEGSAYRNARWVKVLQAKNIYPEIVGRDALAMKRVDAANLAEEVTGGFGMELVLGERFFASQQFETTLVHLDHQGVLATANRAVASREFREIGLDLEPDRAAVAAAFVFLKRATTHRMNLPTRPNARVRWP